MDIKIIESSKRQKSWKPKQQHEERKIKWENDSIKLYNETSRRHINVKQKNK